MAGITLKKLGSIEKSLQAVFADDEDALEDVTKSLAGLKAAIAKGEQVTMADVSDILGDVVIEKAIETPASAAVDGPQDPIAPIMEGLFKSIFGDDGQIKKGLTGETALELFNKAYGEALSVLDTGIEAAAEATAIELGHGDKVVFGKAKKPKPGQEDPEDAQDGGADEDCEDMEKLLKSLGVPAAVVKKIGALTSQVETLQAERDIEKFAKQADEIGEGAGFGPELLKLHQLDPKLAASISKRLKSKNEALRKSSVWDEIGGEGGELAGSTAIAKLNAKATELVSKGEKDAKGNKLTFAKAFTEVCNREPALYNEYLEESRKR